jgi:hypothetical protein
MWSWFCDRAYGELIARLSHSLGSVAPARWSTNDVDRHAAAK